MTYNDTIVWLHKSGQKEKMIAKQKRFGFRAKNALGIYHDVLKEKAREIGYNSELAIQLFDSGVYEARILCSKIFDPKDVTPTMAERWVKTFENWEICDSFSMGLFARSDLAVAKAIEWSSREREFEKRAGFTIMATYGMADKEVGNDVFESFLPIIQREAHDTRIHVKKAINWALRNIGKRNIDLNKLAIAVSYQLIQHGTRSAKWIGNNALTALQHNALKILDYPRKIYRPTTTKEG